ncbi:MAG: hypothetical protein AAGM38_08955 [Pseudomonadota bacterium]
MGQASKQEIDRAILRHRLELLWRARWALGLGAGALAAAALGLSDLHRPSATETLTLTAQTIGHSDSGSRLIWVLERRDGARFTARVSPSMAFEPGARFCAEIRRGGVIRAEQIVHGTLRPCP